MRSRQLLPGFPLTFGYTVFYLSLVVLIPLLALGVKGFSDSWAHFWQTVTDPRVVASYRLSFGVSFLAALVNGFFGLMTAWVLVRYDFPGRRLADALVDLPFALPTAVAGIALTSIYAPNGPMGKILLSFGIEGSYTRTGVFIALTFIGLPFVVRTLQPVIQDLSSELEEAAASLGANRWQTFSRVTFPALFPVLLTGMALAFGRAVGEYGSVIFISGNLPFKTEITPLLIVTKLEQYDYSGAAALGFVLVLASFVILAFINLIQWWNKSRSTASLR